MYKRQWAYKTSSGTSGVFDITNWTFGGVNCTDGSTTTYTSSCPYPLCPPPTFPGCTDSTALNYDPTATIDDGSCFYFAVDLSLQGIIDFTVPTGGVGGKAIHLFATDDISDLSTYAIGVANNGGGTDSVEYVFPAISVLAGDQILVCRDTNAMSSYFDVCFSEFDHVLLDTEGYISQNGDDAIELFKIISSSPTSVSHTVSSGNFYYTPTTLNLNTGDTVVWLNNGGFHNVNFVNSSITGLPYGNPESFITAPTTGPVLATHVFNISGSYTYDCSVGSHAINGMVGYLNVTNNTTFTSVVVETFGDINVDGSGTAWEYMDSWAYKDTSGSVTFSGNNWIFGGVNCTDGSTTTYTSSCPYPLCPSLGTPGCTDPLACNYDSLATVDDGSCYAVLGCTDPLALNYDSIACIDDGSCVYCSYGCTDPLAFNYDSLATCDDGSCIPFVYGCTDSTAINFYPGANTDDGSCIYAGCTDPNATNYDPTASVDDGSCTYMNCTNPSPTGLSNNWVTDTKAGISWNNMNDSACMVWKYYVRYREVGTPTWTTKSAGVGNGLCNFGLNTTTKTLQNLTSSTTYEYKMKAFYCGGTESNYSAPSQFTTAADCPPMTNLTATTFNGNQAKVRFDWDSTGTYVFARVALRVDTAGANWQTAGGFGVYYPTLQVNKFGLQPGESYRAQGRTFCDSNITSYRSWWTSPIFWTQPGSIRLNGGTVINNLDVYPNPTNDIFCLLYTSDAADE